MLRRSPILVGALCLAIVAQPRLANAQVPPAKQAALLLRILAYDRNLTQRPHNKKTIRIAVIYAVGVPESLAAEADMVAALKDITRVTTVAGFSAEIVRIPFSSHLEQEIAHIPVSAVYLCAGLGEAVEEIVSTTRKLSILSFGDNEAYVKAGISVALLRHGSRAGILVNLPNSRAEGSDFDPEILSLFEVTR